MVDATAANSNSGFVLISLKLLTIIYSPVYYKHTLLLNGFFLCHYDS